MEFEPTLSSRFVAYVRDYLLDRQIEPGPVFEDCDIPWKDEDYDAPVPVHKVARLLERAAEISDNSCMGMRMGQDYHYEAASMLIMAMMAAPRVESSLKCLNRYDKYVDTGIETRLDFDQPLAEFCARLLGDDDVERVQLNEYLMVFLAQTLFVATRQRMPVEEVWLSHSNEVNAAALVDYFAAPIIFGQPVNKLIFDRTYLQAACFTSNALLFEILTNALQTYFAPSSEQGRFIDRVAREIVSAAEVDSDSAERIAERLAISARTLRRRLAEEGFSFQEAKNLAREKHAKYFLAHTTLSLSEIAFKLGYSELSAFSRAFRAWTGLTPQNYREQTRKLFRA
ncbi:MAG: AraC family transcriptional regulator ligand-binding domain-containing protein [Pseudomonadota bacterium]